MDPAENQDYSDMKYHFKQEPFEKLMSKRISEILLICNEYDAFMLEEDGRIEERVFSEYSALHLRFPPHFNRVSSFEAAIELMKKKYFDLVITLHNSGSWDAFKINSELKKVFPNKAMVVLAPFSRKIMKLTDIDNNSSSDYIFSWLGDTSILVAIIKLIEDKMNIDDDISAAGVQVIILVEDSIRYYSSYLPVLYETLFQQTLHVMSEDLNDHQKNLRMRGRPKILLATNYEQALSLYKTYRTNVLGVITDVEYNRDGVHNKEAGIELCKFIRKEDNDLPLLVQSSVEENRKKAHDLNAGFINKRSETLLNEIGSYVKNNFGFGAFKFIDKSTKKTINTASSLKELHEALKSVPPESLAYHAKQNHFSRWLRARTLFQIAKIFKPKKIDDFEDIEEVRSYLVSIIKNYRKSSGAGIIAQFNRDKFDEFSGFARIGIGSIGGKARGLAFMDHVLKKKSKSYSYYGVVISIPQTVVLATDIFTKFMEKNSLYDIAFSDCGDKKILASFTGAELPGFVKTKLSKFLQKNKYPLAIRSSSLLEDSYYQPFAGIYATYMVANNNKNIDTRLKELTTAIKCVYASTYFKRSKKYLQATKNVIEEERMAVIIQKISGEEHKKTWYPTFSGVARSINDYPIGYEKHNISIANIAAGLGKTIVDGEVSLRFSPSFPNNTIQLSSTDYALKFTQKHFYALNLKTSSFKASLDESVSLLKKDVYEGCEEGAFEHIVSTYDNLSNIIRDTNDFQGPKIVTFANILKRETFPLSRILLDLLKTLEKSMSNPVEIEFAVNIDPENNLHSFDLLQARPISSNFEPAEINISDVDNSHAIIKSFSSLGNGVIEDLYDLVYVVPEKFDASKTGDIAKTISRINKKFSESDKNFILIGPGRWGTSDPWLGIPVRWADVSQAAVIVEAGQKGFVVQQSQGSHFFHNITTFGVFYFTINPFLKDGFYDLDYLAQIKPEFEDDFVRHISTEKPIIVKTDGKSGHGVILKP
ncbi:MAG: PEP/pyruvate-binding domain-containing protein [Candidatus Delongbacteria bacterium]